MVKIDKSQWKSNYFAKLNRLLDEFPQILIVTVDNVGSKQMQLIRLTLRGRGELLLGKNTMIRKCIEIRSEKQPELKAILPHIKGNVGFVFTKESLSAIKKDITKFQVSAPAKSGAIAPIDVFIPGGLTPLGPEKTNFFQALAIPTKITKGNIELLSEIHLIKKGERVGASEATLLNMMAISPFSYGLIPQKVYSGGFVYNPEVLDLSDDDLRARFVQGVRNIAALSLAIGYPTAASAPHSIVNGLKKLIAIAAMTDISFPAAEKTKAYLKDPSAFAAAAPASAPAAAAPAGGKGAPAPKKEEPKKEESEEESAFDLFG